MNTPKLVIKTFEQRMRELDTNKVIGEVDVYQWDPRKYKDPLEVPEKDRIYLVKGARNKLLRNWWVMTYNHLDYKTDPLIDTSGASVTPNEPEGVRIDIVYQPYTPIQLGTDTSTPTSYTDYKLASPLDINPDTRTVSYGDNFIYYTATWNAGKVTQTIGEIGLIGETWDGNTAHPTLFGRLAVADGTFSQFTPDPTLPLTVVYKIYG